MHLNGSVEPALAGPHRRLGLDQDQRNAVDQQHQIGALFRLARPDGELLGDDEAVLLDLVEVDQADGDVFAIRAEGHQRSPSSHAAISFAFTRPSDRAPMTMARRR